jgi:general secretion pathway protein K
MMQDKQTLMVRGAILASQDGVALLMVLWTLTILSVIVFSFTMMARTEAYSSASFRAVVANRFLAEAGIERGIVEIFYRTATKGQTTVVLEGGEAVKVDGTPYTGKMDKGQYTFRIMDESGKIPLNGLTDSTGVVLTNLLTNMGYQQEEAETVVDSILDWRDEDELRRLHGAESEYYMTLPNPYKAKNGPFDTVEELILVKGVTPAMLYGDGKKKGIINFLTVSSSSNTINVNAAPKEVLMAVPGMDPDKVELLMIQRKATATTGTTGTTSTQGGVQGTQGVQDLAAILGEKNPAAAAFLSTSESNVFSIEATGNREGARQGYGIRAIVTLDGNTGYRYVYYKSPAQVEP